MVLIAETDYKQETKAAQKDYNRFKDNISRLLLRRVKLNYHIDIDYFYTEYLDHTHEIYLQKKLINKNKYNIHIKTSLNNKNLK